MTYQPVIPIGGYAGWVFLNRTMETQQAAFNNSAANQRDVDYFSENIGDITSAEDLVNDRRLLGVALGAFGLDDDINNKYFIQKVLDDGTLDSEALANKLSDKRYYEFSKAFGFGDFDTPNTVLSDFSDDIVGDYLDQQFELAIGSQDEDMRLALNLERSLGDIAELDTTDSGRWFTVMGNEPIRSVFETALGLPSAFASLDIDKQLEYFREKTEQFFGDAEVTQFSDPEKREELVKLFLLRSQVENGASSYSASSNALALLTGAV